MSISLALSRIKSTFLHASHTETKGSRMRAGFVSRPSKKNALILRRAVSCLLGVCALVQGGCSEQDMVVQPKYLPLQKSDFFVNGQSSRPIEPGTVARGQLILNTAFETGTTDGKILADAIPIQGFDPQEKLGVAESREARRTALERGRERYNIFCAPCHARTGDGDGIIVQRGFTKPPSLHEQRLREAPPGHFFHVITNGFGAMYSYSSRISAADRWAIIAYIRALQLSRDAKPADLSGEARLALEKEGAVQ